MKIAIIGGTGLLGSNLIEVYSSFDVRAFSRRHYVNIDNKLNYVIDFENMQKSLLDQFKRWKPDVIINTVAIVNLQKCEDNYKLALETNCNIAKNIAIVAKTIGSYFVHISTDHYYNDKKSLHNENDKVTIMNNYAKTKFLAEEAVFSVNPNVLVVRTNIIGFRKSEISSFFEWLIENLHSQNETSLYSNFFTSPIAVKKLAPILLQCYAKRLEGVYNIASSEVIDKYNFGMKTAEKFNFNKEYIREARIINKSGSVNRALTLGLDVSKIENSLKIKMPTIEETLETLYKEYKELV